MRAAVPSRAGAFLPVLLLCLLVVCVWTPCTAAESAGETLESTPVKRILTIDRIFGTPSLTGSAPSSIRWLPDSRGITFLDTRGDDNGEQTHLIVREVPSGDERTLCIADTVTVPEDLRESDNDTFGIASYRWAETGDLMMFHFRDEIFTFNRRNGEVVRRTQNDADENNAIFSPDGDKIAFTRENDLWMVDLGSSEEIRFTTTGSDTLLNGVLDWVYMEELFTRGDKRAYWWSPDSKSIAFFQFDESPVPEFPIVDFVPVHNTAQMQRYPKPGDPCPIVRVGVIDVSTGETTWINVDTTDDSYIARLYWLGDGKRIAIEKLNRAQDELTLLFADARSGETHTVLTETSDAWVNVTSMTHYYESEDRFVWSSERDGYSHLYLYKNDGTLIRPLTGGTWDVSGLNGVDEEKGRVYFTGLEESLLERHVYRVSESGGSPKRITQRPGTHSATFSPNFKYYVDRFSNITTPRVITMHNASGKELFTIDEADVSELVTYELPVPEFLTIASDEGLDFYCSMITPPDFDPSRKYPVIVYTYAFPNAQVVRDRWGGMLYLWHAMMAQRGYIVFSLDNRGSYGRGREWADMILKTIGQGELEDQIFGAEYLKSLPYVNGSRIGIWGWSGGGTMTALAMLKAPGVFKAGAAVAPVTDFRFYDSIYTERYMKLPVDNANGYHEADLANFASGLEGALLLAHGTSDDNVHVQNTMVLARALISAGKDFELMVYPRGRHGIGGNTERAHLFKILTAFFEENLRAP